jgi:hypothetical protein
MSKSVASVLVLVTALAALWATQAGGHGGDIDTKETVTGKEQPHQPHVLLGKCKDPDCAGLGSKECTGDRKECGGPKSCPPGNCISKEQSCCCRRAGVESLLASAEMTRLGMRGDKGCCRPVPPAPPSAHAALTTSPSGLAKAKCLSKSDCKSDKCKGDEKDNPCGSGGGKNCPTGNCVSPATAGPAVADRQVESEPAANPAKPTRCIGGTRCSDCSEKKGGCSDNPCECKD